MNPVTITNTPPRKSMALIVAERRGYATVEEHVAARRVKHEDDLRAIRAARAAARVVGPREEVMFMLSANAGATWFFATPAEMETAAASGFDRSDLVTYTRGLDGRVVRAAP